MFPSRYFANRMFASRYFPKFGLTSILVYGPIHICDAMAYIPGAVAARVFMAGAKEADIYVPGAKEAY